MDYLITLNNMLKPIYYLLTLPIIFIGCINQESNHNNKNIIADSIGLSSLKKDSVLLSVDHEEQVKDSLFMDGSVKYAFDTLSFEFNVSDMDYKVVYQKDEQLYFFDVKTQDRILFPDSSRIFHFGFSSDGNILYYTAIINEALHLKRARLNRNKAYISTIRIFDIPVNDFKSFVSDIAPGIDIHGDTLSFGCGPFSEQYSFQGQVNIVSKADSSYKIRTLPAQYRQKKSDKYNQHLASISERFSLLKRNKHKELFLITNSDTIQVSDIDSFYKENYEEDTNELEAWNNFDRMVYKTVKFSPDGSTFIYSYPTVMYDFVHGPTFIVNINGNFLRLLTIDGGFDEETTLDWLPGGNNLVFLKPVKVDNRFRQDLSMTTDLENDVFKIEENVDQYRIR